MRTPGPLKEATKEMLEWCGRDPGFLDSLLVEISCVLGRAGEFETALECLGLVQADMQELFGNEQEGIGQLRIVNEAIRACQVKDRTGVPELETQGKGECPIQ